MFRKTLTVTLLLLSVLRMGAQSISSSDTLTEHRMHATYYSDKFEGRHTSSGEIFRQKKYTAAHKTLKFGTLLLVTNPKNGKQVIVKVNDRCPRTNVIDLTRRAARSIGITSHTVIVQVLPQRYKNLWEKQEEIEDLLQNGHLLESLTLLEESEKKVAQKVLKDEAAKNTNSCVPALNDDTLYDIELTCTKSRSQAVRMCETLPIYLRDKVELLHDAAQKTRIVLRLSMKKSAAEELQKQLSAEFPDCRPLPAGYQR